MLNEKLMSDDDLDFFKSHYGSELDDFPSDGNGILPVYRALYFLGIVFRDKGIFLMGWASTENNTIGVVNVREVLCKHYFLYYQGIHNFFHVEIII